MNNRLYFKTCLIICLLLSQPCVADLQLDVEIEVDKAVYSQFEPVNWTLYLTTSGNTTNFGLATSEFDLAESTAETPTPASSFGSAWSSYDTKLPGTSVGSTLLGLSVIRLFSGTPVDPSTKTVLAEGSYTATVLGDHVLSVSGNDSDQSYFTDATLSSTAQYSPITYSTAAFEVVPEPSAALFGALALGLLGVRQGLRVWWGKRVPSS